MSRAYSYSHSRTHSPTFPSLHLPSLYLHHSSFSDPSVASSTSQFILQPFFRFSYVASSSLNLLILQPFRRFIYATAQSPTLPSLYLRDSSFSNASAASAKSQLILQSFRSSHTSQLILQLFRCFSYVTAHSPTLPLLHLRHSSFSNPSVASPMSQLIRHPSFHFFYVTGLHLLHLASRP